MTSVISRRRFIKIAACSTSFVAAGSLFTRVEAASYRTPITWRGMALGAEAQIQLYHDDLVFVAAQIERCQSEINRLENLFSLYRKTSAVSLLNKHGVLAEPSIDMIELLSKTKPFSALSGGAFDVTIQPLWQLYADHFAGDDPDPAGPDDHQISAILKLVGSEKMDISATEIRFSKSGMGITLNGIAQGYMTERIGDLLRRAGFENVLVHLGESQAMGGHPDGRPWMVGIPVPSGTDELLATIPLKDQALATSGGYGSPLSADGRHHHLLDPRSGRSANLHRSVSVIAPGATDADMLSTALSILPIDKAAALLSHFAGARAIILNNENEIVRL